MVFLYSHKDPSRSITFASCAQHWLHWRRTSKNLIDCKSGTFAYLSGLLSVLSLFVLARVNKQVPGHSINRRYRSVEVLSPSIPPPPPPHTHTLPSLSLHTSIAEAGSWRLSRPKRSIESSTKLLTHPYSLRGPAYAFARAKLCDLINE